MLLEPFPITLVIWPKGIDFFPEGRTVISHLEVGQFMDDNVLDHMQWGHTQSISKIEIVPTGTTSPTRPGAGDGHLVNLEIVLADIFFNQVLGDLSSLFPIPFNKDIFGMVLGRPGEQEDPIQFQ